jgi:hypothetical protein
MNEAAQLALMVKAKLVFESPGTFLSFPVLSPLSFEPAELEFSRALQDPAVKAALQNFSLAVNSRPAGSLAGLESSDDYLWNHYDSWLNAMSLANSTLGPGDQTAYAAARSVLVVTDSGGFDTDSPKVISYKQHRDVVIAAEQAYNSAKLTATASGPDALAAWQANSEAQLQNAIDSATADWANTGYKSEVEAAQATVARYEAHMPEAMWAQWRRLFNPGIDLITDPGTNASFAASGYTPSDLANQAWTTLHLTGPEIATLVGQAPPEMRALFGDVGPSDVSAISFEFHSAAVVRPWFAPAMFESHFWKFTDGTQLSDGQSPPTGAWPSYVSAAIFVRNVQVTPVSSSGPAKPAPTQLSWQVRLPLMHQTASPAAHLQSSPARELTAIAVSNTAPAQHAAVMMHPFVAFHTAPPATAAARVTTLAPLARNTFSVQRLSSFSYRLPVSAPSGGGSASPAPQQPPASPDVTVDNRISVLAFICKMLPRVPDPDMTLSWPT